MPRTRVDTTPDRAHDLYQLLALTGRKIGYEGGTDVYVMDGKVWWVPLTGTNAEMDPSGRFYQQDYFEFCNDVRNGDRLAFVSGGFHLTGFGKK